MHNNERYDDENDLFNKEHLSVVEMEKLRSVVKTKIAGELTISEKCLFSFSIRTIDLLFRSLGLTLKFRIVFPI